MYPLLRGDFSVIINISYFFTLQLGDKLKQEIKQLYPTTTKIVNSFRRIFHLSEEINSSNIKNKFLL
jgi:hypothetical protein